MSWVNQALCFARLGVETRDEVLRLLADALHRAGAVDDCFAAAVLAREAESPTGLPFSHWAVALPHADPRFVRAPALAFATLDRPVSFRQMGSPEVELAVTAVAMFALPDRDAAQALLTRLIEILRDGGLAGRALAATDAQSLYALLSPLLSPRTA